MQLQGSQKQAAEARKIRKEQLSENLEKNSYSGRGIWALVVELFALEKRQWEVSAKRESKRERQRGSQELATQAVSRKSLTKEAGRIEGKELKDEDSRGKVTGRPGGNFPGEFDFKSGRRTRPSRIITRHHKERGSTVTSKGVRVKLYNPTNGKRE